MAGRKRKNGPREANGRLNRAWLTTQTEKAAMETVLDTRQRLFGLSETDAKQGFAGGVVGRMVLANVLRRDQYDAAKRYLEVRNAYQRSIGAVPDFTQPRDEFQPSLDPEKAWKAFCGHARRAHSDMMAVLRDLMQEQRSPAFLSALDVFLVKDCHEESLVGALRLALNALGRHFGIPVVRAEQEAA